VPKIQRTRTREMSGYDEDKDDNVLQVCGNLPPQKQKKKANTGTLEKEDHRRICVLASSLSNSAPGSSMIGLGGRWLY